MSVDRWSALQTCTGDNRKSKAQHCEDTAAGAQPFSGVKVIACSTDSMKLARARLSCDCGDAQHVATAVTLEAVHPHLTSFGAVLCCAANSSHLEAPHAELLKLQALPKRSTLARANSSNGAQPEKPVIVWFKHDLRTHDHPGLTQAINTGRAVVAFFCFDGEVHSDQLTHVWGPAVVQGAVDNLQRQLGKLNCPLVVRTGKTDEQLLQVVNETGASEVVCHAAIEETWLQAQKAVETGAPPPTSPFA